jgi:hypothetical protein
MEEEAAQAWWDAELFSAFQEMIREGRAAGIPPVARRAKN